MSSNFLFWNCCGGVGSKIDTINLLLRQHSPEIMFISEAEYQPSHSWIRFQDYVIEPTLTWTYGKSRLIALLHQNSAFRKSSQSIPDDLELIAFENSTHKICGVYRPFTNVNGNTSETYFKSLIKTLTVAASSSTKKFCAAGDFNVNYEKPGHLKNQLEEWSIEFDLNQLVNVNTWERIVKVGEVHHLRKSRLDLVFSSVHDTVLEVLDKFNSDHKVIKVAFQLPNPMISRVLTKRRDYRKYNPDVISQLFIENMLNQSLTGDPEFDNDTITECMTMALDGLCPLRSIRTARSSDILDQGLEKAKKKRKRLLKKYNVRNTTKLLKKINQLNDFIKNKIVASRKQQLNLKMQGNNVKSFWNAISTLEGKKIRDEIKLQINGAVVDDPLILASEFADFFVGKVNTLSKNSGKADYSIGHSSLEITNEEIIEATKKMKNKLCSGEDEIPMKVARDIVTRHLDLFREFFNDCSLKGLPERWKIAIITPSFKSGDKEKVTQYRPISNLDSLSKIYERIVLQRLNSMDEMDGCFQHGFKENRSTVTAALELQDYVASRLDSGQIVGTYCIDLSAAFDLLRPDKFLKEMHEDLPLNLLQTLMDFLSNRQFKVQIGKTRSTSRKLLVGCVQGSILGPRLFTLYMRKLGDIFKDAHLVSFADDSYVSIARPRVDEVKIALEETMTVHDTFLRSIGMVTNVEKTELIFFSRKPIMDPPS